MFEALQVNYLYLHLRLFSVIWASHPSASDHPVTLQSSTLVILSFHLAFHSCQSQKVICFFLLFHQLRGRSQESLSGNVTIGGGKLDELFSSLIYSSHRLLIHLISFTVRSYLLFLPSIPSVTPPSSSQLLSQFNSCLSNSPSPTDPAFLFDSFLLLTFPRCPLFSPFPFQSLSF